MPRPAGRRFDDEDDDDRRPRRRRRKAPARGVRPGVIIGGVAALVLVVFGAVAAWLVLGRGANRDGNPRPPVANNPAGSVAVEINPRPRPETGDWQRLTPAGHAVAALAPGQPRPIDPDLVPKFGLRWGPGGRGWEARGAANHYYVLELDWRPDGKAAGPDPRDVSNAMMPYLGLGGLSEPAAEVVIDGLPGRQYEPVKGFGASGVFVYRVLVIRDRVFVFGVNVRPGDPAAIRFFDSIRIARTADGTPAGPTPPSPLGMRGLVAYLSFDDDPPDGRAIDAVSKAPVGVPAGRVGRAAGVRGQALDLSDGTGSFVLTGLTATATPPGQSVTVSVWFRSNAPSGTIYSAGEKPNNKSAPAPHLVFSLIQSKALGDREAVALRCLPGGARQASDALIGGPEPLPGGWTHLAFTRNGATGEAKNYLNGVPVRARRQTKLVGAIGGPGAVLGGLSPKGPGADPGADGQDQRPFAGLIDELAIFDVALGEAEVRRLAGR